MTHKTYRTSQTPTPRVGLSFMCRTNRKTPAPVRAARAARRMTTFELETALAVLLDAADLPGYDIPAAEFAAVIQHELNRRAHDHNHHNTTTT